MATSWTTHLNKKLWPYCVNMIDSNFKLLLLALYHSHSQTTPCNPESNGQFQYLNQIVKLALLCHNSGGLCGFLFLATLSISQTLPNPLFLSSRFARESQRRVEYLHCFKSTRMSLLLTLGVQTFSASCSSLNYNL